MSLSEETKPKLSSEALQSMCRIDVDTHNKIALATEMFISGGGKIQQIPMGMSAEFSTINEKKEALKESLLKGSKAGGAHNKLRSKLKDSDSRPISMFPDNSVKRNKTVRKSGHQNLIFRKNGTISVQVGSVYCGTFDDEAEALRIRDKSRANQGLPKLEKTE